MSVLDKVLSSPEDVPPDRLVKWLKDCLEAGETVTIAIQRDSSPLGSSVPDIIVQRQANGIEQEPRVYAWDDDFNAALVTEGVKAEDLLQEGERYALVLRFALRKVERRFGDGFLNGILIELLDESEFGKQGEISKIRNLIAHPPAPYRDSSSYLECREIIVREIGGLASQLRENLKYNAVEANLIMDKAIARYLDERFSISKLQGLGWIDASGRPTREW